MPDALDFDTRPQSLRELCEATARMLAEAGVEEPAREARWLISAALGFSGARLISSPDQDVRDKDVARVAKWAARRCTHEPLWRIAGERSFYGRPFLLSPETLEPRPDSETIVEAVLEMVRHRYESTEEVRILDVGTGTGCLLVSLLAELPNATGVGTDISEEALRTAAANAERHGVSGRAAWQLVRSLEGISEEFDVLVSNPPYIRTDDIGRLQPEVRLYDPVAALDGGEDGLAVYREICSRLPTVVPSGVTAFEVGLGQHEAVLEILKRAFEKCSLGEIKHFTDLSGHIRCVAHSAQ